MTGGFQTAFPRKSERGNRMKSYRWALTLPLALAVAAGSYGADKDAPQAGRLSPQPAYRQAFKFDKSPPLRLMKPPLPSAAGPREVSLHRLEVLKERAQPSSLAEDPLVRLGELGPLAPMPAPLLTFAGTSDNDNQALVGFRVVPPDTNGDVGPNHYVQWNNLVFEVFDKTGAPVLGPLPGNTLFAGFGGPCETNNDGDPAAVYDQLADRWVLTQFSIGDGIQCVAVSQTGDPTGAYFRYAFIVTPVPGQDSYKLWKSHVDWTTPGSSTFTGPTTIPTDEMDINLCGFAPCVPQQGSPELLDHLSFFTMYRLVYRNFGDHESLWAHNTVNLRANRAGIRWAEIRDPTRPPAVFPAG